MFLFLLSPLPKSVKNLCSGDHLKKLHSIKSKVAFAKTSCKKEPLAARELKTLNGNLKGECLQTAYAISYCNVDCSHCQGPQCRECKL